jgi:hypothetical protein
VMARSGQVEVAKQLRTDGDAHPPSTPLTARTGAHGHQGGVAHDAPPGRPGVSLRDLLRKQERPTGRRRACVDLGEPSV